MAGLVRPRSYPIRDLKSNAQDNGAIVNPLRFPDHGGFTSAGKWAKGEGYSVEAPTRMRTAEVSDRSLTE